MPEELYIGLMSGTSMDGIDAALVSFADNTPKLIATGHCPWPESLRTEMQALAAAQNDSVERVATLDLQAGECLADAALKLLAKAAVAPQAVRAIGSHGQTIRHRPNLNPPFSLQIGDPNRIAERTGITTIADFRRRDMAAGGEGAPLAPAFHAGVFRDEHEYRAVLNIGGIANLTLLPSDPQATVTGFDTGPGNTLLDGWARRHLHQPYDQGGNWGAGGRVHEPLLRQMLEDEYFRLPPPKSTGPEHFSGNWLDQRIRPFGSLPPRDIQATLVALTAESIARALGSHGPAAQRVLVCGGGVHNRGLMKELEDRLDPCVLDSTASHGLDPDWVEAAAFAWLAQRTLQGLPGNLPSVTGARRAVILGGIYPA